MVSTNGKAHGWDRVARLEELAFGYVDDNNVPHDGFLSRLARMETYMKIVVGLSVIPALHYLGVPTEAVGHILQGLATLLRLPP